MSKTQTAGLATHADTLRHHGVTQQIVCVFVCVCASIWCIFVCVCLCVFLTSEQVPCPLWKHSLWHCRFKVSIACLPSWPRRCQHSPRACAKVLAVSSSCLCTALLSPPLHNYPSNCGVIDCITCSWEALALFNKQLECTPHVVGERGRAYWGERKDWSWGERIGEEVGKGSLGGERVCMLIARTGDG